MIVYAFDVDDTLDCARGPVPVDHLRQLRGLRNIVGINGNWRNLVTVVPDWWEFISFMGPVTIDPNYLQYKVELLTRLSTYVAGKQEYVMVGNRTGTVGPHSIDDQVARAAKWRFIEAHDWAKGAR